MKNQKELSHWLQMNCFNQVTGEYFYKQACIVLLKGGAYQHKLKHAIVTN